MFVLGIKLSEATTLACSPCIPNNPQTTKLTADVPRVLVEHMLKKPTFNK